MKRQSFLKKMVKLIKAGNPEALEILRRMSQKKQHEILIARDDIGWTLTHWAIYQGNIAMARSFIEICIDPNVNVRLEETTGVGWLHGNETMLHIALRYAHRLRPHDDNNGELAQLLLECGADPTARDQNGQTALHWACDSNCLQIVQRLIITNPELLYVQDKRGNTPLHIAIKNKQVTIARLLMTEGGAKLMMLRNHNFQRPLDLPESLVIQDQIQRRSVRQREQRTLMGNQEEGQYQQNNVVCLFREARESMSKENSNKRHIETNNGEAEMSAGKRTRLANQLDKTLGPK